MEFMSKNIKALLIQIRDDHATRIEEWESFSLHSGLEKEQIEILNTFDEPNFKLNQLEGKDCIFIGGASEASVLDPKKYPFVKNCIEACNYCVENSIPTFASCFGFQTAILAFGGDVLLDSENFEMGTVPINLTQYAKEDPLFKDISNPFLGISVHKEYAKDCPENSNPLALTDHCLHSFKVREKPFWAFQFHPELDVECLTKRLYAYRDHYTDDLSHYDGVIASLQPTPQSNSLVGKFMKNLKF